MACCCAAGLVEVERHPNGNAGGWDPAQERAPASTGSGSSTSAVNSAVVPVLGSVVLVLLVVVLQGLCGRVLLLVVVLALVVGVLFGRLVGVVLGQRAAGGHRPARRRPGAARCRVPGAGP